MNSIAKYFEGEKFQCTVGIIISVVCISFAVYFIFLQKPLLKGISFSFIPLCTLLLIICIVVVVRSSKDIERVTAFYKHEPKKMQTEELPRMEKVMNNFSIIKKVEICIFIAGIILSIIFWKNDFVKGIGMGLVVLGLILYLFDHAAEARGKVYHEFLKSL